MNIYLSLLLCAFLSLSSYGASRGHDDERVTRQLPGRHRAPHGNDPSRGPRIPVLDLDLGGLSPTKLLKFINEGRRFHGLQSLILRNPQTPGDIYRFLRVYGPGLKFFSLCNSRLGPDDARDLFTVLQTIPGLRLLHLQNMDVEPCVAAALLGALETLPHLKSFKFSICNPALPTVMLQPRPDTFRGIQVFAELPVPTPGHGPALHRLGYRVQF